MVQSSSVGWQQGNEEIWGHLFFALFRPIYHPHHFGPSCPHSWPMQWWHRHPLNAFSVGLGLSVHTPKLLRQAARQKQPQEFSCSHTNKNVFLFLVLLIKFQVGAKGWWRRRRKYFGRSTFVTSLRPRVPGHAPSTAAAAGMASRSLKILSIKTVDCRARNQGAAAKHHRRCIHRIGIGIGKIKRREFAPTRPPPPRNAGEFGRVERGARRSREKKKRIFIAGKGKRRVQVSTWMSISAEAGRRDRSPATRRSMQQQKQ